MSDKITEVGQTLKKSLLLLKRDMDETLRPYDVTSAQMFVLATISKKEGDLTGADLARIGHISPQAAQTLIAGLEKRGWLSRERHPSNEKILLLELTKKGQNLIDKAVPERIKVFKKMMTGFSASELETFQGFLERFITNLESAPSSSAKAASKKSRGK